MYQDPVCAHISMCELHTPSPNNMTSWLSKVVVHPSRLCIHSHLMAWWTPPIVTTMMVSPKPLPVWLQIDLIYALHHYPFKPCAGTPFLFYFIFISWFFWMCFTKNPFSIFCSQGPKMLFFKCLLYLFNIGQYRTPPPKLPKSPGQPRLPIPGLFLLLLRKK